MFPHRVFKWIQYRCIIENNCQFSAGTIISPSEIPTGVCTQHSPEPVVTDLLRAKLLGSSECWTCRLPANFFSQGGKWGRLLMYCHNSPLESSLLPAHSRTQVHCDTHSARPGLEMNMTDHPSLLQNCTLPWFLPEAWTPWIQYAEHLGFLKPAQITHPRNITPLFSDVGRSTWFHHTKVCCSSTGGVPQGLVWNRSHLKSSPATFYQSFLTRRDPNIKKPWLRPEVQVTQTNNEQSHDDF